LEQDPITKMKFNLSEKEMNEVLGKIVGRFAFLLHREIVLRVDRRFKNRITVNEENGMWTIGTNDEIFRFWERGTRPHEIKPKNANALKFEWPSFPTGLPPSIDGFHYFKKVNHPGTKGKEVLRKVVEDTELLNRLLEESIRSVS